MGEAWRATMGFRLSWNALGLEPGPDMQLHSFVWEHQFIKLIFKESIMCQALKMGSDWRQKGSCPHGART